jgi:hypothetical protein
MALCGLQKSSRFFVASFAGPYSLWVMQLRWFFTLASSTAFACAAFAGPENEVTKAEQAAGWRLLFDGKSNQGWHSFKKQTFPVKGWLIEEGWLHCLGKEGGDLVSEQAFENFELRWEWKQAPGGNSGLKYFISEQRNSAVGHEYQLIDEAREPDAKMGSGKRVTAAFYDVLKPTVTPRTKPPGEINQSSIVVRGNHVEHWLNGAKVLEYECGSDALKEAIAQSKFKTASGFGEKIKGHILLQDHHSEVWFRNVKIHEIDGGSGRDKTQVSPKN